MASANGPVYAIAATTDAVYIGGSFSQVGPPTGPGVAIDASTGADTGSAEIAGGGQVLFAVVSDGSGGFYVGGSFERVGGAARRNLAHVLSDGSVDPAFKPNPDGTVRALALSARSSTPAATSPPWAARLAAGSPHSTPPAAP